MNQITSCSIFKINELQFQDHKVSSYIKELFFSAMNFAFVYIFLLWADKRIPYIVFFEANDSHYLQNHLLQLILLSVCVVLSIYKYLHVVLHWLAILFLDIYSFAELLFGMDGKLHSCLDNFGWFGDCLRWMNIVIYIGLFYGSFHIILGIILGGRKFFKKEIGEGIGMCLVSSCYVLFILQFALHHLINGI